MAAGPARPEPVLHNGRGHNSERPAYHKIKKKKSDKNKETEAGGGQITSQRSRSPKRGVGSLMSLMNQVSPGESLPWSDGQCLPDGRHMCDLGKSFPFSVR